MTYVSNHRSRVFQPRFLDVTFGSNLLSASNQIRFGLNIIGIIFGYYNFFFGAHDYPHFSGSKQLHKFPLFPLFLAQV